MSSMVRATSALLLLLTAVGASPAQCQDGAEWDQARARLATSQRGTMAQAVERWRALADSNGQLGFSDYAGFIMAYPGFPEEPKLRGWAEAAITRGAPAATQVVAFFDRLPPVTNQARGQYALALAALGRPEAQKMAIEAWRSGPLGESAEATLFSSIAPQITPADHDERMDALLWAGAADAAQRQVLYVSPARRSDFLARLAMLNGQSPEAMGFAATPEAMADLGYVYNRVRQLRIAGDAATAAAILATRPRARAPARDQVRWVTEMLAIARKVDASGAMRIAAGIDDAFAPGADISRLGFRLRDDYTSLMWLAGTRALKSLGRGRDAAPLFARYGAAARTPYTRAKGYYWAGRALAMAGDTQGAASHFEIAARYPDNFYGLLALERLARPIPSLANPPTGTIRPDERARFDAKPLSAAVREVARDFPWQTSVRFFREISDQAETEGEHLLVAQLAQDIGRRDLAVILGQSAHADGFGNFHTISFPLIPVPAGANWTMVHAISRQESQFAMNALSHAGARGLMQLMPGTAAEEARLQGLAYDRDALVSDAGYNLTLGNGYFARMIDYFNGSYPLAVAAYNAGPGNVNKWLRANGDPRNGGVDWIDWIEAIPLSETRNYVQRVLENAVVYEALYPQRASYRGANPMSHFIGKPYPG